MITLLRILLIIILIPVALFAISLVIGKLIEFVSTIIDYFNQDKNDDIN